MAIMQMNYGLRINNHAADHGALIVHGLGPAIRTIWTESHAPRIAVRSHWLHGPHVLIGMTADDPDRESAAWSMLHREAENWLRSTPSATVIDAQAYLARSRNLAVAEGLDIEIAGLRPDNTVERGSFFVADFLRDPNLSVIRDDFKAATLPVVLDIIERKLHSPAAGLLDLAHLFLHLERVNWRDGMNFWPVSLAGQANATTRFVPQSHIPFETAFAQLEPLLAQMASEAGTLRLDAELDARGAAWVADLQRLHDAINDYVDSRDDAYFAAFDTHSRTASPALAEQLGLNDGELTRLLSNRRHFAYRVFVNMLYEMFPTIGYSTGRRLFVCHLVVGVVRKAYPAIMERSNRLAARLIAE